MDAVKFINEKDRLFNTVQCHQNVCLSCPRYKLCKTDLTDVQIVEFIEDWSIRNPVDTYESILLSKFPEANINNFNIEDIFGKRYKNTRWSDREGVCR